MPHVWKAAITGIMLGTILCVVLHGQSPSAPALSEAQKLKVIVLQQQNSLSEKEKEVAKLKTDIATLEQKLIEAQASNLIEEFRKTLKANPDDVFDFQSMTFRPKSAPTTPQTPIPDTTKKP